jgi:hypothetical protein
MGYAERLPFLQKKYKQRYEHPDYARQGGFLKTKKRKQLLGIFGQAGRDRKKYDFWHDVRQTVKTALIDLELFIETADDNDVNTAVNKETLGEVILALLYNAKADSARARIAQLCAEHGLRYLRDISKYITQSQKRTIEDAIGLSKQLTILLLPDKERDDFFYSGGEI